MASATSIPSDPDGFGSDSDEIERFLQQLSAAQHEQERKDSKTAAMLLAELELEVLSELQSEVNIVALHSSRSSYHSPHSSQSTKHHVMSTTN